MEHTTTKGAGMYNATAYTLNADGSTRSATIVELDADGLVIRAAGYWTHTIGTQAYDAEWRGTRMGREVRIEQDGGAGYKSRLAGLGLPPAYRAA